MRGENLSTTKDTEAPSFAPSRENKQGGFETRPYTRRMTIIFS